MGLTDHERTTLLEAVQIIADHAYDTFLEGGQHGYTCASLRAICDKPDNMKHAAAHLKAHMDGRTDEAHLEHCLTRCGMELIRLYHL